MYLLLSMKSIREDLQIEKNLHFKNRLIVMHVLFYMK